MLPDGGTQRSQQIFSDLNRTVHKTSKSLDILYDHRLPVNQITMECANTVALFRGRTDKERVSLSVRNRNFATPVGPATRQHPTASATSLRTPTKRQFQRHAATPSISGTGRRNSCSPWSQIADGTMTSVEARQDFLSSYTLVLWALGRVGAVLRERGIGLDALSDLANVNWRKDNPEWGRHLHAGQRHHHQDINA